MGTCTMMMMMLETALQVNNVRLGPDVFLFPFCIPQLNPTNQSAQTSKYGKKIIPEQCQGVPGYRPHAGVCTQHCPAH